MWCLCLSWSYYWFRWCERISLWMLSLTCHSHWTSLLVLCIHYKHLDQTSDPFSIYVFTDIMIAISCIYLINVNELWEIIGIVYLLQNWFTHTKKIWELDSQIGFINKRFIFYISCASKFLRYLLEIENDVMRLYECKW